MMQRTMLKNVDGVCQVVTGAAATNVGVMAKRIHQMEKKKRQGYLPPAEGLLAGDLPSSESDQSETDSAENTFLINE